MSKQLNLLELHLTNFKGIRNFDLVANGEDINVYGDNEAGKTTIFDAFVWLLFNKDSRNKKDFEIKTLVNGKPLNKLNHEVEAKFLVDGAELSLKKVYKEKWTKKRSNPTPDFTGHTTDYFIDGVPSKKKDFTDKVASIVDEDIFKLLTNPSYFNEQLHWKDRRNLLLEIAGDVTDEDVIASNKDLEELADILSGRSIEDHRKVIAAKRKEINQELDRIPVRIDEINRNLPDVNELNKEDINRQLEDINSQIEAKQQRINDIRNGSEVNNIRKQISDIDLKINNVKNEHENDGKQELYKLQSRLQEEQSNLNILKSKVDSQQQRKDMNERNIKDLQTQMQDLREQWNEQNDKQFDHESSCTCPTCKQELPEEQIEEAKANFNRNKSELLEKINQKGQDLKTKVEAIQQDNESIEKEIAKLNSQIDEKKKSISSLEAKKDNLDSNVKPLSENVTYQQLMNDRQALEQKIEEIEKSVEVSVQQVQEEISALKEKQSALQIDLSKVEQSEQSLKRIGELENQEQELSKEFEQLEKELYLTEEFIRTKVNLLEEKINNKFQYARFNLFKKYNNGGLEEICETTYKGVPYSGGLNNAAQINVGLDIINTLSKHYGVEVPIFVDNAESVTKLIDIDSQLISLVVSENDKQLRIENNAKAEVA
ncbi:AAA domain-containing protein [Salinibacillus kushneri]|uniref:Nuclease SbcCD subunit C n=1 Tax=Salinibacillus kushneri TaxID=237682 RepID=A0A1I0IH93_9BACI|nr:AAA family ATPase [Salinibacillus kushneri]SET95447.1 AAA domain-containing protein [Salinibacillus kushneri]